jgi:hypothetical protein
MIPANTFPGEIGDGYGDMKMAALFNPLSKRINEMKTQVSVPCSVNEEPIFPC